MIDVKKHLQITPQKIQAYAQALRAQPGALNYQSIENDLEVVESHIVNLIKNDFASKVSQKTKDDSVKDLDIEI